MYMIFSGPVQNNSAAVSKFSAVNFDIPGNVLKTLDLKWICLALTLIQ